MRGNLVARQHWLCAIRSPRLEVQARQGDTQTQVQRADPTPATITSQLIIAEPGLRSISQRLSKRLFWGDGTPSCGRAY